MLIIEIQNDMTGTERSANYKYTVSVNDEVIEIGTIKGHNPSDGWRFLVTLVGTPPGLRSAVPVGVKVESLLTMRAADLLPQCEKCGSSFLWSNNGSAVCANPECGNRR